MDKTTDNTMNNTVDNMWSIWRDETVQVRNRKVHRRGTMTVHIVTNRSNSRIPSRIISARILERNRLPAIIVADDSKSNTIWSSTGESTLGTSHIPAICAIKSTLRNQDSMRTRRSITRSTGKGAGAKITEWDGDADWSPIIGPMEM